MKDPKYTAWLKKQSCCWCRTKGTEGHHTGAYGSAKRLYDNEQIPVCRQCHTLMHDGNHPLSIYDQRRLAEKYRKKFKEEK